MTSPTTNRSAPPPEERFWQRYSPYNELPLSGLGSVTLYLVIAVALVAGVKLGAFENAREGGLDIETRVWEGDNAPVVDSRSNLPSIPRFAPSAVQVGALPLPPDQVGEQPAPPAKPADKDPIIDDLDKLPALKPIVLPVDGPAGPGKNGAPGEGKPGVGGAGEGNHGGRQSAQLRWHIVFNTRHGEDYRKQLESLGAILAIPNDKGEYLVIRELKAPAKPAAEDVAKIQRIFWVDDRADSIGKLAQALGIAAPAHVVAFFPNQLEEVLHKLERDAAAKRGIPAPRQVMFTIELNARTGKYEPRVTDVK